MKTLNIPLATFLRQNKNEELANLLSQIILEHKRGELEADFSEKTKETLEYLGFIVEFDALVGKYVVKW